MPRRLLVLLVLVSGCGLVADFDGPFESSGLDGGADMGVGDGRTRDGSPNDGSPGDGTIDGASPDAPATIDGSVDGGGSDVGAVDADVDAVRPPCPPAYRENDVGTCYRWSSTNRDWQSAERDCESDGGHLVVVNSLVEDDLIPDMYWIGYSETIAEGSFLWVTGADASTYERWATGEPDFLPDAWCTVQRPDDWHDDNCFELKGYVCEYDGRAADPATWR